MFLAFGCSNKIVEGNSIPILKFMESLHNIEGLMKKEHQAEIVNFSTLSEDDRNEILVITAESYVKQEHNGGYTVKGQNVVFYWIDLKSSEFCRSYNHYEYGDVSKNTTSTRSAWKSCSDDSIAQKIYSILSM